jgi:hypothetical protein
MHLQRKSLLYYPVREKEVNAGKGNCQEYAPAEDQRSKMKKDPVEKTWHEIKGICLC